MQMEGMRCLGQLPAELHLLAGRARKVSINSAFQGAYVRCIMHAAGSCRFSLQKPSATLAKSGWE